jgi:hypothetical protein
VHRFRRVPGEAPPPPGPLWRPFSPPSPSPDRWRGTRPTPPPRVTMRSRTASRSDCCSPSPAWRLPTAPRRFRAQDAFARVRGHLRLRSRASSSSTTSPASSVAVFRNFEIEWARGLRPRERRREGPGRFSLTLFPGRLHQQARRRPRRHAPRARRPARPGPQRQRLPDELEAARERVHGERSPSPSAPSSAIPPASTSAGSRATRRERPRPTRSPAPRRAAARQFRGRPRDQARRRQVGVLRAAAPRSCSRSSSTSFKTPFPEIMRRYALDPAGMQLQHLRAAPSRPPRPRSPRPATRRAPSSRASATPIPRWRPPASPPPRATSRASESPSRRRDSASTPASSPRNSRIAMVTARPARQLRPWLRVRSQGRRRQEVLRPHGRQRRLPLLAAGHQGAAATASSS